MNQKVVVLNTDYGYLNVVDPERAFLYLEVGKAVVEKFSDSFIRTVDGLKRIPLIVRMVKLVRQIYKKKGSWSKPNILIRDNNTCVYCGVSGSDLKVKMTIDHIFPSSKGGKSTWENTACACPSCNNKKGNKLLSECGMFFQNGFKPYQPTVMEFIRMKNKRHDVLKIIADYWEEMSGGK